MTKELLDYFHGDDLAASTWKNKYALEGEVTPDDMHRRMAKEFARIEVNWWQSKEDTTLPEGLSDYAYQRNELNEESIYQLFKDFKYTIPQGSVMSALGASFIASLSNCVVVDSPMDSYGGIFKTDQELAQLMKRRCGVGTDISNLRPEGTETSNAAKTTTGAVSFMDRFSNTTREVAQNGRRGALMLSMHVNHPDSLQFAQIKQDLSKVTGANISIKLTDEFMKAVEADEDYLLRFPVDAGFKVNQFKVGYEHNELYKFESSEGNVVYIKKIRAKEYWEAIVKAARDVAEPGLLFWDNMVNYSPDGAYPQFKQISTNPCFTGDNKLLTVDGFKSFLELEDTEFELIDSEGEIKNGKVWKSGYKDIVEVSTWGKHIFKSTPDHVYMTTEGEYEAKELKGKRLLPFYSIKETYGEFTALGFLQGDGGLGRLTSEEHLGLEVNIGKDDEDIKPLFGVKGDERVFYIRGYNTLLKNLGFSSESLPNRNLPTSIDTWKIEDIKDFLTGLYSANGSIIKGHRISFKNTCKSLIEDLQYLLKDKLDIDSYYTTNKSKKVKFSNGEYLCKESYDLNISKFEDVVKFAENISFVHKYKKESLKELILIKSPLVKNVKPLDRDYVYDFSITEGNNHWGVVAPTNNWKFGFIVHNCSEIGMQANDTCRLIANNLFSFVKNPFKEDAYFDFEHFYKVNYESARLSDDLVDLEIEHINRILDKIESDPEPEEVKKSERELWTKILKSAQEGRRVGLGFTALADTLAALGLKYDSNESFEMVEQIMREKKKSELDCTIDLAILRGSFEGWNVTREFSTEGYGMNPYYQFLLDEFPQQAARMIEYGRRNVSISTVAPTGSLSMLAQTSSGIEPVFMLNYKRRRKENTNDKNANITFVDDNGDAWEEFNVNHHKFKDWYIVAAQSEHVPHLALETLTRATDEDMQKIITQSPYVNSTANEIDWERRVKLQGIIQKYITHSISSTINLPSDVTEEEVGKIYIEAWKQGLKGITVYRDGARSGVLVSNDKKEEEITKFHENHAPTRPKYLDAKLVRFNNNKEKWIAFVGLLDGKPYEIFTGSLESIKIPLKIEEGQIGKVRDENGIKRYDFIHEEGIVGGINKAFNDDYWNYAKMISSTLRHGMPLHFAIEMIKGLTFPEDHINTWKNGVARALKRFIPDGQVEGMKCDDCGDTNVVFEEGCSKCLSCGSSKCS